MQKSIGTVHSHPDAVLGNIPLELSISSRYEITQIPSLETAGPSPKQACCPKSSSRQCLNDSRRVRSSAFTASPYRHGALVCLNRAFVHRPFTAFLEFVN